MSFISGKLPLVSMGLPVYNGERYLQQSIGSLLSQDYGNLELIISDNNSTDSSLELCQEYQSKDNRIRLYKNDSNIGATKNFNKVFHLSSGKYFMLACHDNLWDKSYVSKCVAKLEENPTAVMCVSEIQFIDELGNNRDGDHIGRETDGMDVVERVHTLISRMGWFELYGVIRPEYLRRTHLTQEEYRSDVIVLLELLLLGEFVKVPEKIFHYRLPFQEEPADEYMAAIDPAKSVSKPYTGMARDILQVILNSGLEDSVKCRIQTELIKCLSWENLDWRNRILKENISNLSPVINVQDVENIVSSLILTTNESSDEAKSKKNNRCSSFS
jgi:glycosyltransferase involved in cell wall biosynthesis